MAKYDDLDSSTIGVVGFISVLVTFLLIVGTQALYYQYEKKVDLTKNVAVEAVSAETRLAQQKAAISNYGRDRDNKDFVHLPIDRAMELVIQEEKARQLKNDTARLGGSAAAATIQ